MAWSCYRFVYKVVIKIKRTMAWCCYRLLYKVVITIKESMTFVLGVATRCARLGVATKCNLGFVVRSSSRVI